MSTAGSSACSVRETKGAFGETLHHCESHNEYGDVEMCWRGSGGTECPFGICGGWKSVHTECEKMLLDAMEAGSHLHDDHVHRERFTGRFVRGPAGECQEPEVVF